jgi:hypothetical protein
MVKYYLKFIFYILKINPIKILLILLTIVSFYLTNFEDKIRKIEVVNEIEHIGDNYIIIKKSSENKFKLEIKEKDENIFLKDGFYYERIYNEINILFWTLFSIGIAILIIMTIFNDEYGWEIDEVIEESILSLVLCEIENDKYCYTIMDRLIGKNDKRIKTSYILSTFGIRNIKDVYLCPKYQTKSKKRELLLNEIGI